MLILLSLLVKWFLFFHHLYGAQKTFTLKVTHIHEHSLCHTHFLKHSHKLCYTHTQRRLSYVEVFPHSSLWHRTQSFGNQWKLLDWVLLKPNKQKIKVINTNIRPAAVALKVSQTKTLTSKSQMEKNIWSYNISISVFKKHNSTTSRNAKQTLKQQILLQNVSFSWILFSTSAKNNGGKITETLKRSSSRQPLCTSESLSH